MRGNVKGFSRFLVLSAGCLRATSSLALSMSRPLRKMGRLTTGATPRLLTCRRASARVNVPYMLEDQFVLGSRSRQVFAPRLSLEGEKEN